MNRSPPPAQSNRNRLAHDRRIRLYVDEPLTGESVVTIAEKRAHYLVHVMRARVGETITLFDGVNGEWRATITDQSKSACTLTVVAQTRAQEQENGPTLLFAPIKRAPLEFLVEKATELGAGSFWPVVTDRTVAGRISLDRLRLIAIEAAEQCGRLTIPRFAEPTRLSSLAERWPADASLWLLDTSGRGQAIAEAAASIAHSPRSPPGIFVGPEGGFTPSELDALEKRSIVTFIALGRRTLRCETAALSALACWQAVAGDWCQVESITPHY